MTSRVSVSCGVDVGSTNLKVALILNSGEVVARLSRATPRDRHQLTISPFGLVSEIESMILQACGSKFQVRALSICGIGEDGLFLDRDLLPVSSSLTWFDPRRRAVYRQLESQLGTDAEDNDVSLSPTRSLIGWRWSRDKIPSKAAWWISITDFPAVFWTKKVFCSDTIASRTGAWSSSRQGWSSRLVEQTLGKESLLPPVFPAGHRLGTLGSKLLLSAGAVGDETAVFVGGHDHPVGAWGVGKMYPGSIVDSMGTAEVVLGHRRAELPGRRDFADCAPGILESDPFVFRVIELSENVRWASQDPSVGNCIRKILEGKTSASNALFDGHFCYGSLDGATPSYDLGASANPLDRASAVLGALAFAGKEAIESVRSLAPGSNNQVCVTGGWSQAIGWMEIKSLINGFRSRSVPEPEVSAVSCAALAAVSMGEQPDFQTALSSRT